MQLWHHQTRGVDAVYNYFAKYKTGNVVLEAPTSSGKSLMQAEIIKLALEAWPKQRFLCLTHVREIIEQNEAEMLKHWPRAPTCVYSAGLKRRELDKNIIFAGIHSIYNKAEQLGHIDLIFIDECHMVPVRLSSGMYRTLIDALKVINPKIRVVGLSASLYRLDNGRLDQGKNRLFTHIISAKSCHMEIDDLLLAKHICRLTTEPVKTKFDVEGVPVSRFGDFAAGKLERKINIPKNTIAAVREMVSFGKERNKWLTFACGIKHAHAVAEEIKGYGIHTEVITGKTGIKPRSKIIEAYKHGDLRSVVNIGCLSTGLSVNAIDLIAMMLPTKSVSRYQQILGRGMRNFLDKIDCLVLDFAGNIDRHGPINDIIPPLFKGEVEGEAPVKECPYCFNLIAVSARECTFCNKYIPINTTTQPHDASASKLAVLADKEKTEPMLPLLMQDVCYVVAHRHTKEGRPDSLILSYMGYRNSVLVNQYLCLDHGRGKVGTEAREWHAKFIGKKYKDINDSIDFIHRYFKPEKVLIQREDKKFPQVIGVL